MTPDTAVAALTAAALCLTALHRYMTGRIHLRALRRVRDAELHHQTFACPVTRRDWKD